MIRRTLSIFLFVILLTSNVFGAVLADSPETATKTKTPIKHFLVLMQENHSFDNYFGTYPGANGYPEGAKMPIDPNDPTVGMIEPWHIGNSSITDLSHSSATFKEQYNEGEMDSFVSALNRRKQDGKLAMGYYDDRDIPYYWNLADTYVLFDRFFSSAKDGSFANHMFWAAAVAPPTEHGQIAPKQLDKVPTIFDRLQGSGISWKFYVQNYDPTITYRNIGASGNRASQVIWVPLLNFDRFIDDPTLSSHIVDLSEYFTDLRNGTLPSVAYIIPSGPSEHPPSNIQSGERFVKNLIQELMRSSAWESSAFMLAYDDWGGWYDHVLPPQVDEYGYGLRVPALLVSPYARKGRIDSTQLDFTSMLKFIEENWSLAPLATRDAKANNFLSAFDFKSKPRKAEFLPLARVTPDPVRKAPTNVIYIAYGIAGGLSLFALIFAGLRTRRNHKKVQLQNQGISN